MISTRQVFEHIKALDLSWHKSEKLIQELAWRDYWQQIWIHKGDEIHTDLKNIQQSVSNREVPKAIINANTGITAADQAIKEFYQSGYMHNHMRMYVASICCNIANSHWLEPARWLYAHLLDGDLASNQLSWQWVAGAFSNKKYYANQENINKYFKSAQKNTFLDIDYSAFGELETPEILSQTVPFDLETILPDFERPKLHKHTPTLIYNYYNLDPAWHADENVQRILLLEPSLFRKYPVSQKCIKFVLDLKQNVLGIEVFVGEFDDLTKQTDPDQIVFKEHPLNKHYRGHEEPREWMGTTTGYFPSFFAFWKKYKKEIQANWSSY